MQKDTTEKKLEDWNDVYADIINVLFFGGKKVLKEEELISLPTESFTRNMDGTIRKGYRDVRKADGKNGAYRLIWGVENQECCDNTMPERIMGYEYASYEEQVKFLMDENEKCGNPAYTKRLHDGQLLSPVITGVLYWGDEEWKGPRTLHEMLRFPEDNKEEFQKLVADYPIHLIQVARLPEEVRTKFTSDFRLLAEYASCKKDPVKRREFMKNDTIKIRHPEEFMDAFIAIAGDKRYKELASKVLTRKEKENITMCILFEEAISEGLQQGIEQGLQQGIEQGLQQGIEQGLQQGIQQEIQEGIRILIESCKKLGVRKEDIKKTLMEEYHLSGELAEQKMEIHWKAE